MKDVEVNLVPWMPCFTMVMQSFIPWDDELQRAESCLRKKMPSLQLNDIREDVLAKLTWTFSFFYSNFVPMNFQMRVCIRRELRHAFMDYSGIDSRTARIVLREFMFRSLKQKGSGGDDDDVFSNVSDSFLFIRNFFHRYALETDREPADFLIKARKIWNSNWICMNYTPRTKHLQINTQETYDELNAFLNLSESDLKNCYDDFQDIGKFLDMTRYEETCKYTIFMLHTFKYELFMWKSTYNSCNFN